MTQDNDDSPRHYCFGCGVRNAEGLRIAFEVDGMKVVGRFSPRQAHQGFPGIAHGGISAAAMDEAMGWAMYAAGAWAVTARMEVKYRGPLPLEQEVLVTAEVTSTRGRRLEAEAKIHTLSGELLAEAHGLFLRMPEDRTAELNAIFLGDPSA